MSISDSLWTAFADRLAEHGERTALITTERRVSFGQVAHQAEQLAGRLAELGVQAGDVLGLALPNRPSLIPAFLALCKLDTTVALVSTKYRQQELQAIVRHTGLRCFLCTAEDARRLAELLELSSPITHPLDNNDDIVALMLEATSVALPEPAPALIKFTSGSTGQPKGVGLTSANILAETESVVTTLKITPEDNILALVPLTHSYGFDLGVLACLHSGARLHIGDGFVPRLTLGYLQSAGISIFLGVPSMYRALTEARLRQQPDLSSVRYLLSCTAPLSAATIVEFHERFGLPICQHYGSSETGAATTHVPTEVLNRADSVGLPMHNVTIRVESPDGEELPIGADGEVVVSGPAVAPGYVMGKPTDRDPLRNGAYRTGEIGRLDVDGYLHLKGRIDQLINVGGHKVGPDEVVQVLERHTSVGEAGVIGLKDAGGEEFVYAAVTLRAPASESDLIAFCRNHLAEYKIPRRIDVVDKLPRGATGKIQLRPEDIHQ